MQSPERALVSVLLSRSTVQQQISDRLYPQTAPPGAAYPHATFFRVSTRRTVCMTGTVSTSPRIRIDSWATDYPSAKRAADAIADVLNDFVGNVNGGLMRIQGCWVDDELDDYEPPELDEKAGVHRAGLELVLHYSGA